MRICVIPARGGSKRIPRKNIKEFCGKPIISYSIEAALRSQCFDKVIVSTDCEEISLIAKNYGAEIPFLRPSNLSGDYSSTNDVIKHAIKFYQSDFELTEVCCLYPTAPFVSEKILQDSLKVFLSCETETLFCFSATKYNFPIQRSFKFDNNRNPVMFFPEFFNSRSQDLEVAYHDAGQFYWGKPKGFLDNIPFFSKHSFPYIIKSHYVQDIDTNEDWHRAEMMYRSYIG